MTLQKGIQKKSNPLRLGFVPLSDCAPIAVAQETGIFDRYGLNIVLSRELGWASVRDKIFYGDLDAAQSIAGIAFTNDGRSFGDSKRDHLIRNTGQCSRRYAIEDTALSQHL